MLVERFEYYKEHLVKGFLPPFSTFDRQIVLVDCQQALHSGPDAMGDLQETLSQLMRSFHQRQGSNWWRRPFAPRIDAAPVATKADHITPWIRRTVCVVLLAELVQGPYQRARFESIEIDRSVRGGAIRASEYRQLHGGKNPVRLAGQESGR